MLAFMMVDDKLRMLLDNKLFLLKHKSHDLFFPPRIVEAILQYRTIMNSNSLIHITEHANQYVCGFSANK